MLGLRNHNQRVKGPAFYSLGSLNIMVGNLLQFDWGHLFFDYWLFTFYHFNAASDLHV